MINLLPTDTRDNLLYARRNTKLLRWIIAISIGIVGLLAVTIMGLFYMEYSTNQIQKQVELSRAELKTQKLEETQKQAENMSNSFKLVTQVLSKQIIFSEVLRQVGAVMPSGASLANLSIEQLQGGIDLQVVAEDYQTATQVQVNLQDPANKLFEKVDIVSVSCADGQDQDTQGDYPCTGSYRALFTDNSPFLFLNNKVGTP